MIKVLFFSPLRDIVGAPMEQRELPSPATLGGVFNACADRFPHLWQLRRSIVLARNQEFCDPAATLADGDEVAFAAGQREKGQPYAEITDCWGKMPGELSQLQTTDALLACDEANAERGRQKVVCLLAVLLRLTEILSAVQRAGLRSLEIKRYSPKHTCKWSFVCN